MPSVHSFNLGYTAPAMDIGSGYARGIESAGKSISHAIDSVSDLYRQNIDANDTLKSLHEAGILKKEEFEGVMGKSLGAKQTMVGQFITNWAGKVKAQQEADAQVAAARGMQPLKLEQMGAATAGDLAVQRARIAAQRAENPDEQPLNINRTPPVEGPGTPGAPAPAPAAPATPATPVPPSLTAEQLQEELEKRRRVQSGQS